MKVSWKNSIYFKTNLNLKGRRETHLNYVADKTGESEPSLDYKSLSLSAVLKLIPPPDGSE